MTNIPIDVAAMKKEHTRLRKKAQYERQAAKKQRLNESLQHYKKQHPEDYKRLLNQAKQEAKRELAEETSTQPTIVFTGELSITRAKASQLAEKAGFKVSNHVSKNTTYVVVGENPGSKFQKATQYDTEILNEEDFNSLLKGQKPSHTKSATCRTCGHKLSDQMARYAQMYGGFTCPQCHTVNEF